MGLKAETGNERLVIEFFNTSGNWDRVRAILHEDATWNHQVRTVSGDIPAWAVHRGHGGIIDDFLKPGSAKLFLDGPKVRLDTLVSKGPLVLAEAHSEGFLADGRPYENLYAWAFEMRDGKIFVIREYYDTHYTHGIFAGVQFAGTEE